MISHHLAEELGRCNPALLKDLQHFSLLDAGDVPIEIRSARDGEATLRIGERFIHSSMSPRREAARLAERIAADITPGTEAVIVFGLGLGYHIDALRKLPGGGLPMIVVEPQPAVVHQMIQHAEATWWCNSAITALLPAFSEDVLIDIFRRLGTRTFTTMTLHAAAQYAPEAAEALHHALEGYRRRREVNARTLRRFGRLWVRNLIHNLSKTLHGESHELSVAELFGTRAGGDAVVCGAGPTLDDVIPTIARMRSAGDILLVAVDTALAPLLRNGIAPDVVVTTDPQYWNTRHLDSALWGSQNIALIADPSTHPRVFRLWQGPIYVSESLFPLGAFVDQHINRRGKIGAGGSVATTAWDVARQLGCTTVYTAGVDLGFPRNHTHCQGSFFEERLFRRGKRLEPAEQGLTNYLHSGSPYLTPATGGGSVITDQRMEVYRAWFAEQARLHREVTTGILAPGGARIEGHDLVDSPPVVPVSTPFPPWRSTTRRKAPPDHPRRIEDFVRRLLAQLHDLAQITEEGLQCATTLLSQEEIRPADLAQLDQYDHTLLGTEQRELVGFLAEEALSSAIDTRVSTPREGVEQAATVYRALHSAVIYHQELLARYQMI